MKYLGIESTCCKCRFSRCIHFNWVFTVHVCQSFVLPLFLIKVSIPFHILSSYVYNYHYILSSYNEVWEKHILCMWDCALGDCAKWFWHQRISQSQGFVTIPLHSLILLSLHPRMLCAKFGWNWPRSSGKKKFYSSFFISLSSHLFLSCRLWSPLPNSGVCQVGNFNYTCNWSNRSGGKLEKDFFFYKYGEVNEISHSTLQANDRMMHLCILFRLSESFVFIILSINYFVKIFF